MVIAIICLIITGLCALTLVPTVIAFMSHRSVSGLDFGVLDFAYPGISIGIQAVIYTVIIVAEVLGIVGACKNNKCLLIPFMIYLFAIMLLCIGVGIWFLYLGVTLILVASDSNLRTYLEQQSAAIDNQDFGSGFGQLDLDNLNFRQGTAQGVAALGGVGTLLMLIPVLIVLAFVIYFFAIVVKFYKQLSSGIRSGEQEGIVLQP